MLDTLTKDKAAHPQLVLINDLDTVPLECILYVFILLSYTNVSRSMIGLPTFHEDSRGDLRITIAALCFSRNLYI